VARTAEEVDPLVGEILAVLRRQTGMDFSRYRAGTVHRRIANRMLSLGLRSHGAYLELLKGSQDEAGRLLDRIAIKVSRFYRHAPAFDRLRAEVVPALGRESGGAPLRLWSAGCGCGEEPYTLAMLLDEAGVAGVIEATDIDPSALTAASRGRYSPESALELPAALAARYLSAVGERPHFELEVDECLRGRVRFRRHDLLFAAVPGWSGFDLVSCRNVCIYLEAEARLEAYRALSRALRPGGVLLLGESEWPPEPVMRMLAPVAGAQRIFRAVDPVAMAQA